MPQSELFSSKALFYLSKSIRVLEVSIFYFIYTRFSVSNVFFFKIIRVFNYSKRWMVFWSDII